jgi:hypothetical protein
VPVLSLSKRPAIIFLFAGAARSYILLLFLPVAHVIRHLGECGRELLA